MEQIARKDYPETALLQQVAGVGPRIALTFVLTVEDQDRFQRSRDVGCYVGLRPRRSDSGQSQLQPALSWKRRVIRLRSRTLSIRNRSVLGRTSEAIESALTICASRKPKLPQMFRIAESSQNSR